MHIGFLHTAEAHVETFDRLMQKIAPHLRVAHAVREDLLEDALQPGVGMTNSKLAARISRATKQLAYTGARVVVCTCSTLGGIVEALQITIKKQPIIATRIDRAVADIAAKSGNPITLVVALESTIQPSTLLVQSSAKAAGAYVHITPLYVRGAWAHFKAGDKSAYINCIVEAVALNSAQNANSHTILLAQASMHDAVAPLAARGVMALSNPELGVRHALALLEQDFAARPELC